MSPLRLSYRWFILVWICSCLMWAGGLLSAAAHFREGFVCFIIAAPLLLFLGLSLAMNVGELSDRMTQEVTQWGWVLNYFGLGRYTGWSLVILALFAVGVGIVGLAQ